MSNKNKVWRIVEGRVAEALRLKRVAFSGGIWPNKEDAEDLDYICQMKATERKSITIKVDDINALMRRAIIQHKIPLFVFHFDQSEFETGQTWVAVPIDEFKQIKEGLADE